MHQPRSRVPAFCLLSAAFFVVLACSGPEQSLLGQFFSASRLRDNTSLDNIATVIFDPRTQGTVMTFTVQTVAPEQRKALLLKALAKAQEDARAEDAGFTKRKEEYQNANLEAIQRVLKAEREHKDTTDLDTSRSAQQSVGVNWEQQPQRLFVQHVPVEVHHRARGHQDVNFAVHALQQQ